jgi:uncharacterized protein YndB with AHSA1/START domain
MTISPIVKSVVVKPPPVRAFDLFVSQMGRWWPTARTPGKTQAVDIVVEPQVGGRWFERDAEGVETQWGDVLAYEPPQRLVLGWRLNARFVYDPELLTEVEITFSPAESGGTAVRLEHRNLERFGADAERLHGLINQGWPERLTDFQTYAERAP